MAGVTNCIAKCCNNIHPPKISGILFRKPPMMAAIPSVYAPKSTRKEDKKYEEAIPTPINNKHKGIDNKQFLKFINTTKVSTATILPILKPR